MDKKTRRKIYSVCDLVELIAFLIYFVLSAKDALFSRNGGLAEAIMLSSLLIASIAVGVEFDIKITNKDFYVVSVLLMIICFFDIILMSFRIVG